MNPDFNQIASKLHADCNQIATCNSHDVMTKNAFHWTDHDDSSAQHAAALKRSNDISKRGTRNITRARKNGTDPTGIYGISRASDERITRFRSATKRGK